jgi:anaerobic magnesium-protoporphyrin IX monomethyl ester cyclase
LRILIINPPHPAIGSRIPDDHLPPLGLLSIGGPLIDDGHDVALFDAEFGPASMEDIERRIASSGAEILLLGHSGSTSAHPIDIGPAADRSWRNSRVALCFREIAHVNRKIYIG